MAEEKTTLAQRVEILEAKNAAIEETLAALLTAPPAGESVTSKAAPKVALTSETFKVEGVEYRLRYPSFHHDGRVVTQAQLLADPALQAELVAGGFKVIEAV